MTFVPTLNGMGYMTQQRDRFMQAFVDFSARQNSPVLDVGAAFGVATLAALEKGATVIANDLDSRHLAQIEELASEQWRSRLTFCLGEFPQIDIDRQSLGAILVARVLHFFTGPQIEVAVAKMGSWLQSGGKVFITAETPYLKNFQSFIPQYENNVREGKPWPGWVEDVSQVDPVRAQKLPQSMNMLDPEVLRDVFEKQGFIIEEATYFSRPEFPPDLQWDGRESVGLIALKP